MRSMPDLEPYIKLRSRMWGSTFLPAALTFEVILYFFNDAEPFSRQLAWLFFLLCLGTAALQLVLSMLISLRSIKILSTLKTEDERQPLIFGLGLQRFICMESISVTVLSGLAYYIEPFTIFSCFFTLLALAVLPTNAVQSVSQLAAVKAPQEQNPQNKK